MEEYILLHTRVSILYIRKLYDRVTTDALKNKWNLLFFHPERIQCSAGRKSRDMTF